MENNNLASAELPRAQSPYEPWSLDDLMRELQRSNLTHVNDTDPYHQMSLNMCGSLLDILLLFKNNADTVALWEEKEKAIAALVNRVDELEAALGRGEYQGYREAKHQEEVNRHLRAKKFDLEAKLDEAQAEIKKLNDEVYLLRKVLEPQIKSKSEMRRLAVVSLPTLEEEFDRLRAHIKELEQLRNEYECDRHMYNERISELENALNQSGRLCRKLVEEIEGRKAQLDRN